MPVLLSSAKHRKAYEYDIVVALAGPLAGDMADGWQVSRFDEPDEIAAERLARLAALTPREASELARLEAITVQEEQLTSDEEYARILAGRTLGDTYYTFLRAAAASMLAGQSLRVLVEALARELLDREVIAAAGVKEVFRRNAYHSVRSFMHISESRRSHEST